MLVRQGQCTVTSHFPVHLYLSTLLRREVKEQPYGQTIPMNQRLLAISDNESIMADILHMFHYKNSHSLELTGKTSGISK